VQIVAVGLHCLQGGHPIEWRFLLDVVLLDLCFGSGGEDGFVVGVAVAEFGGFGLFGPNEMRVGRGGLEGLDVEHADATRVFFEKRCGIVACGGDPAAIHLKVNLGGVG